jgi:hypothetical protein
MKIYADELIAGISEMMELHKQGNNIFEMKDGSLFPHHTAQSTWEFSRGDDKLHLSDGTHTFSFKGQLADYDSELEKLPEVPLPDIFVNSKSKGKAQVHRSDPGSIYFTLQEGRNNPTYTLKHMGDNKWKAIPKPKKVKDMLKQPITPHNVNLDYVKEGMLKEVEFFAKQAGIDEAGGKLLQEGLNLVPNALLMPGRIGGAVTKYGDPNPNASESLSKGLGSAALSGGIGAGAGGLYHLLKRKLLNTQAENDEEDAKGGYLKKRIMYPGLAMAGLNIADRNIFPAAIDNPSNQAFPALPQTA